MFYFIERVRDSKSTSLNTAHLGKRIVNVTSKYYSHAIQQSSFKQNFEISTRVERTGKKLRKSYTESQRV